MKMGDIIAGFISGLMVCLVVFILVTLMANMFHINSTIIGFVTALLLAVLVIALVGKIRKSALIVGMVIALTIGAFACAKSEPFDAKFETGNR